MPLFVNPILPSGAVPFTGDQSHGSHKITNLADATSPLDAVNLETLLSNLAALDSKQEVTYCSTAALPANTYSNGSSGVGATLTGNSNGPLVIDGVTLVVGNVGIRVLVAGESAQVNNGWYTLTQVGVVAVSPYILTRAVDSDQAGEIGPGYLTGVEASSALTPGVSNNQKVFISIAPSPFIVGSSNLTFAMVGGTYAADGTTLTLTGLTFSVTTNGIGNSQLRQGIACAVVGRSANSTGNVADIQAGSDNQILIRRSGALTFTTLVAADLPVMVAAGGSHAAGAAPDPGATSHSNRPMVLKDTAAFDFVKGEWVAGSWNSISESTTSTTFADLTHPDTTGSFTLDVSTVVNIKFFALSSNTNASVANRIIANIDGSTVAASTSAYTTTAANGVFLHALIHQTTLAAGTHTIKIQMDVSSGTTGTWFNRLLEVVAIG